MDRYIERLPRQRDLELALCQDYGIAYQADMSRKVDYDAAYFDKCAGYEDQAIALAINAGRIALVNKWAGDDAEVLDVGIGSGEFIKKRPQTFGHDINPKAIAWLKAENKWRDALYGFEAFTFWDVLEHVENPDLYFHQMLPGALLFCSLPIFADLTQIRSSKHYRPDEHLYYFTQSGFVGFMAHHRFALLEVQDFETRAGREAILSFAFVREAT